MWYAVWVCTGQEEKVRKLCCEKLTDSKAFEGCFLPRYEIEKKEKGKWIKREEILFPGYLFFVAENAEKLSEELRRFPEFTRILGDEDGPIPLYQHEVDFLQRFADDNQVFGMSVGDLIGGKLEITSGPLKDYQGRVIQVNRHKRQAILEMEFFGRIINMKVGLEIVRKV